MNLFEIFDANSGRLLTEGARIQHLEDLIFFEGSAGAKRAIQATAALAKSQQNVTLKWDGSPAVWFGRDEFGKFTFTDKSGFGAKGYDGRATSPEDLENMLLSRKGGTAGDDPRYRQFAGRMAQAFVVFEQAVPENFRGYFTGDMLYFSRPPVQNNEFVFRPNVVEYRVAVSSDLGQKIKNSTAGIAVHAYMDTDGKMHSPTNISVIQSNDVLVVPPVTVAGAPKIDTKALQTLDALISKNSQTIDALVDSTVLRSKKITDFSNIMYSYLNRKVDTGLDNLGSDFFEWLPTSKVSAAKQEKIREHVAENESGFIALWQFITGMIRVKDYIIQQIDQSTPIKQSVNGESGGEGYVINHPGGMIKLVSREFFSKANRAVER